MTFARKANIAFAIILLLQSCQAGPGRIEEGEFSVNVDDKSIESSQTSAFVTVKASCSWKLSVDREASSWVESIEPSEGSGNNATVRLKFQANDKTSSRSATLTLTAVGTGDTASCTFTQLGCNESPSGEIKDSRFASWMELPAMPEGSQFHFISHPMTIGGKNTRNFSLCWDVNNLVAPWVAYPLNTWNKQGNSGRTDDWGNLDPAVPRKYQPVLRTAYYGFGARGHQIPSADRQIDEYNRQTYYGTNLTPQDYDLNGGVWSQLEGRVRSWCAKFDTLYVATGCVTRGSTLGTKDNDGKRVTVPVGYFKALLGYQKKKTIGITSRTGGYTGIGFYFDNRDYPGGNYMDEAMTLEELENQTGMTFFVNLASVIGASNANTVKSTRDSWWN